MKKLHQLRPQGHELFTVETPNGQPALIHPQLFNDYASYEDLQHSEAFLQSINKIIDLDLSLEQQKQFFSDSCSNCGIWCHLPEFCPQPPKTAAVGAVQPRQLSSRPVSPFSLGSPLLLPGVERSEKFDILNQYITDQKIQKQRQKEGAFLSDARSSEMQDLHDSANSATVLLRVDPQTCHIVDCCAGSCAGGCLQVHQHNNYTGGRETMFNITNEDIPEYNWYTDYFRFKIYQRPGVLDWNLTMYLKKNFEDDPEWYVRGRYLPQGFEIDAYTCYYLPNHYTCGRRLYKRGDRLPLRGDYRKPHPETSLPIGAVIEIPSGLSVSGVNVSSAAMKSSHWATTRVATQANSRASIILAQKPDFFASNEVPAIVIKDSVGSTVGSKHSALSATPVLLHNLQFKSDGVVQPSTPSGFDPVSHAHTQWRKRSPDEMDGNDIASSALDHREKEDKQPEPMTSSKKRRNRMKRRNLVPGLS